MSGYVQVGYVVGLGTLAVYAVSLVTRERAARRRLEPREAPTRLPGRGDPPAPGDGA
jgi:hypothetical protein